MYAAIQGWHFYLDDPERDNCVSFRALLKSIHPGLDVIEVSNDPGRSQLLVIILADSIEAIHCLIHNQNVEVTGTFEGAFWVHLPDKVNVKEFMTQKDIPGYYCFDPEDEPTSIWGRSLDGQFYKMGEVT